MSEKFLAGDRVKVSDNFFWAKGATGTISAYPDAVNAISGSTEAGLTRNEVSALGANTVYWVWFDEPQYDADGDGPIVAARYGRVRWRYQPKIQTDPLPIVSCDNTSRWSSPAFMPLDFLKLLAWCVLIVLLAALWIVPDPYKAIKEIWDFWRGK